MNWESQKNFGVSQYIKKNLSFSTVISEIGAILYRSFTISTRFFFLTHYFLMRKIHSSISFKIRIFLPKKIQNKSNEKHCQRLSSDMGLFTNTT